MKLMMRWTESERDIMVQTIKSMTFCGPGFRPRLAGRSRSRFKIETFKASNGWLQSFKKRHNIVFWSMTEERGDVDLSKVTDWKYRLKDLCVGYDKSDLFNMDETGLFFRDTRGFAGHYSGRYRSISENDQNS